MKVYKDQQHSLMLKPFGMAGKQYCGVTVFVYFDLTSSSLLKEQQLWQETPQQLGKDGILDMGMPKPRGEFLVYGCCHAPSGSLCRASKVNVSVANVSKTLYVFGPRYWTPLGSITEPESFSSIPLNYGSAFGGPEYERNPLGRGFKTMERLPSGKVSHPLPLVEDPRQLIGSLDFCPEPASFQPLNMTWPQRARMTGTFGDAWFKSRWPDMPDDMDPLFYNTAAPDQQQSAWYAGDERIEITNMHPDMPLIESRLPGKRIRLFLTMFKDYDRYKKADEMDMEFVEVPLHIDTVTLFPEIMRGVVHFRGSVASQDDEYHDVVRAFISTEEQHEPPKDIEYFRDEQLKRLDRGVKVDMAPYQEAGKKLSKLALKMKKLPKEVERIGKKALGDAPYMPRTPEELGAMSKDNMAMGMATLDKLEGVAKSLHEKFGHKAAIDLKKFDKMRAKLGGIGNKLQASADKVAKTAKELQAEKQASLAEADKITRAACDPEILKTAEITPEMAERSKVPLDGFKLPSSNRGPYHERGFPLVVEARKRLEKDADTQARLRELGFDRETIKNAWLGILPEPREDKLSLWRTLPDAQPVDPAPPDDDFTIPAGLVMPRFDGRRLTRVLLRTNAPSEWSAPGLEELVPDSANEPLALYPVADQAHWVRVADELQALYAEQELGDACGVISLATPDEKPDKDALEDIGKAGVFLCIMPAGTGEKSAAWQPWADTFPNAKLLALPEGRTVFEAEGAGHGLRKLVMDALPKEFAKLHSIDFDVPEEAGKGSLGLPPIKFPDIDLGAKADGFREQGKAKVAPKVEKLTEHREAALGKLGDMLAEGGDKSAMEEAAAAAEGSSKSMADELNKFIANRKDFLQGKGYLNADQIAAMDKAQANFSSVGNKLDAVEANGEAMFANLDKRVAGANELFAANRIPGMSLEEMKAKGIDPDRLTPLTREKVIVMLERNESLANRDFSGADLSELDFSNRDLRKALFIKTKLKKAVFDNATLDKAIFREADLSEASCKGTSMRLVSMTKCKCKKATFATANLNKVNISGSDLTEADMSESSLRLTTIQKSKLNKANFRGVTLRLAMINHTDLSDAVLAGSNLSKGMVVDATLHNTDFSGATVNRIMFKRVKGEKVIFAGADMSHARMTGNNELAGANFTNTKLDNACLRQCDFSGADFTGASMNKALVEFCDLSLAKLRLVSAKRARLLKTNLESADMAGMNLLMGSLRKSRLVRTDLTAANLYCVDFFKSVMHKTVLDRANIKRTLLHKREDLLP